MLQSDSTLRWKVTFDLIHIIKISTMGLSAAEQSKDFGAGSVLVVWTHGQIHMSAILRYLQGINAEWEVGLWEARWKGDDTWLLKARILRLLHTNTHICTHTNSHGRVFGASWDIGGRWDGT